MQNLTVGEQFRILMKRDKIKQTELAENLGIDKRNVSQSIKLFDENRGTIKTLIEYAEALGYNVKIEFEKEEKVKLLFNLGLNNGNIKCNKNIGGILLWK